MRSAKRSLNGYSTGRRRNSLTHELRPRLSSRHPGPHPPARGRAAAIRIARVAALLAVMVWLLPAFAPTDAASVFPALSAAAPAMQEGGQTPAAHAEAAGHATTEGEGEGEGHESPWAWVARLINFAILAGGLVYLLRSPFAAYLESRGVAIRADLAKAAEMRAAAAAQMDQIEERMKALPAELDALRRRATDEIAAEEARIKEASEAERQRMLEQSRREIQNNLRVAERQLKALAADLAVGVAAERLKRTITAGDHARLIDRYVGQVKENRAS